MALLKAPQSVTTKARFSDAHYEASWNLIASAAVLIAASVELSLREAFYHASSEAPGLLLLLLLGVLTAAIRWRFARANSSAFTKCAVSRALVLAAIFAWWRHAGVGWQWVAHWWWLLLPALCTIAVQLRPSVWAFLCRSSAVAIVFFVMSQPVLAWWRAPNLVWPEPTASAGGPSSVNVPEVTVVVLLDELSASAAGPIAEAMTWSGYPVLQRAIQSSGDATAKVVPSLLLRREFKESKPCSWHTVCSEFEALNVDRVTASRPDIDVVGFYFPYCAIKGLRSCNVISPESPYFDFSRWRCAAQRRSEWLASMEGEAQRLRCAEQIGVVWKTLGQKAEAALWKAPVWQRGGVLYAHLPLPHPPGDGGDGSLEMHYRTNINKAARLIGEVSRKLASSGRPFSLVVFSDHPLRAHWCESMQYRDTCPPKADLFDRHVPLLATGIISDTLRNMRSNMEIFDLIRPSN